MSMSTSGSSSNIDIVMITPTVQLFEALRKLQNVWSHASLAYAILVLFFIFSHIPPRISTYWYTYLYFLLLAGIQ